MPYDIINLKDTNYTNKVNPLANKTIISADTSTFELQTNKLKNQINENISEIENKQQRTLKELKAQLKMEIEQNKKLFEKLKTFGT